MIVCVCAVYVYVYLYLSLFLSLSLSLSLSVVRKMLKWKCVFMCGVCVCLSVSLSLLFLVISFFLSLSHRRYGQVGVRRGCRYRSGEAHHHLCYWPRPQSISLSLSLSLSLLGAFSLSLSLSRSLSLSLSRSLSRSLALSLSLSLALSLPLHLSICIVTSAIQQHQQCKAESVDTLKDPNSVEIGNYFKPRLLHDYPVLTSTTELYHPSRSSSALSLRTGRKKRTESAKDGAGGNTKEKVRERDRERRRTRHREHANDEADTSLSTTDPLAHTRAHAIGHRRTRQILAVSSVYSTTDARTSTPDTSDGVHLTLATHALQHSATHSATHSALHSATHSATHCNSFTPNASISSATGSVTTTGRCSTLAHRARKNKHTQNSLKDVIGDSSSSVRGISVLSVKGGSSLNNFTLSTSLGVSKRGASTGGGGGVGEGGGKTERKEMGAGNGQVRGKMRKEEAGRRVPPQESRIEGSGLRSAAELPPTSTQIQVCQNNTCVLCVCL